MTTLGRAICAALAALTVALTLPAAALAAPTFADPGFAFEPLVTDLPRPVAAAWTPDGRMLIASKDGKVFVATRKHNGDLTGKSSLVIDISSRVNTYEDHGLLGIAVDSNHASNHYVYLLYTYEQGSNSQDTGPKVSQLMRVVLNPDNSVGNSTVILGADTSQIPCPQASNTLDCIPSEGSSHSIGTVRADPDGTLWVGSGDAAGYGGVDQLAFRSYDETSYAGKILHIDREGRGLPGHPFCPSVQNLAYVCTKLYAKGFRNPFRFTLRTGGAGPVVGDVGWGTREELDMLPAVTDTSSPRDFGWPCWEGAVKTPGYRDDSKCNDPSTGEYTKPTQLPVYDFLHSEGGVAVVGGPTYYGTDFPVGYRGTTLFGDYGSGILRRYDPGTGNVTQFATGTGPWVDLESAPDGLGYASAGDLIYVDINDFSDAGGSVGRVYYSAGNHVPVASMAGTTPTFGPTPLTVSFKGNQSTDADNDALTYDWDFGDGVTAQNAGPTPPPHTYSTSGRYTARLTVDDGRGLWDSADVVINVGAPAVTIARPSDGSLYRDGDTVALQGSATDAGGQPVADSGLSWRVTLRHATHAHDLGVYQGGNASFIALTDHDANSHYDVTLTATDTNGLKASKTVTIHPQTVQFTIASSPSGARVSYAGTDQTAPFTTTSAVGFKTSISAAGQLETDTAYGFSSWSDGGAQLHDITIPAGDATVTATYTRPATAVTAPAATGAVLSSSGASDRSGPRVTFDASATSVRRGRLTGKAGDPSGVAKVQTALRAQGTARGCRWWSLRRRGLARTSSSCRKPAWMTATLTRVGGTRWAVSLGRALSRGNYVLLARAVDSAGNVSTRLADGRSQITLRVRPARRTRR